MTVFAAIIRTTGSRNHLLPEALHSLSLQSLSCLAIIVVHGTNEAYAQVREACGNTSLTQVLHAPNSDPSRRRGYPINVGIEYCLNHLPDIQYLFLLDDDDIVYPFYTRAIADAFACSGASVVYEHTNRRETGKPLEPSFALKPYYHLLEQNFIHSNGYAVRTAALRNTGVRVDETLEYLEDWHFLLRLLEHGLRFYRLDLTLSEYRTEPDADYAFRNDMEMWRDHATLIRQYINRTAFPIHGADLALWSQNQGAPADPDGRFADSSVTVALHRRVWDLEHSLSWKVTAPLRASLGSLLRLRSWWKARR